MTKVFKREYYDKILITLEGHSGYGAKGNDIVCAGVSTLACNFINCMKDEEADGRIKLHKCIIRDGYVHFEIEIFDFAKERLEGFIESFMKGLYMLSEEYPQYVKFE